MGDKAGGKENANFLQIDNYSPIEYTVKGENYYNYKYLYHKYDFA